MAVAHSLLIVVSDDGMHGARAEGALSGFELQFETEWIDRGPAATCTG
jgi:hypothetical protein